jgi:hypothetical protein
MRKKEKITDYKNFWLIWLNCAGKPEGLSLFSIQSEWGIKTNYLYHNETGLKEPLYIRMIRENYLEKDSKRLKAKFSWISTYVQEKYMVKPNVEWTPNKLILQKWTMVQGFIEKHADKLFSTKNLRTLYKDNKDLLGNLGPYVFMDVFLYVFFTNLINFTKKYHADIVLKIIATVMSIFTDRDLFNYMRNLNSELGQDVPLLISDERELNSVVCHLNW